MAHKQWLEVFTRVNNRKKRHIYEDMLSAGYPMVVNNTTKWKSLHDLCKGIFVDAKGRSTYIWFGEKFFFLNEEDAHVFRSLLLIA